MTRDGAEGDQWQQRRAHHPPAADPLTAPLLQVLPGESAARSRRPDLPWPRGLLGVLRILIVGANLLLDPGQHADPGHRWGGIHRLAYRRQAHGEREERGTYLHWRDPVSICLARRSQRDRRAFVCWVESILIAGV